VPTPMPVFPRNTPEWALRKHTDAHVAACNCGDAKGVAGLFDVEAVLTTPTGAVHCGREGHRQCAHAGVCGFSTRAFTARDREHSIREARRDRRPGSLRNLVGPGPERGGAPELQRVYSETLAKKKVCGSWSPLRQRFPSRRKRLVSGVPDGQVNVRRGRGQQESRDITA